MKSLRVLTLNLWNDCGDPQRRMEVAVAAIQVLRPDLIGLQEVREAPDRGFPNQAETIARALDARYVFAPVASPPEGPVGNAVISRLPILRHDAIRLPGPPDDPRGVLRAEIQTPSGNLVFACTHLSWELDLAVRREEQAVALDRIVSEWPSELPRVLVGDFNATPDTACLHFLTGRSSLLGCSTYYRDCFARKHPRDDGFTWSAKNPYVPRYIERERRIDYVLIGPQHRDGVGHIIDCRVALDVPATDGAFSSDHFGVLAEIAIVSPGPEPRLIG